LQSCNYWIQKVSIRNSVNVCSEHMNWIKVNWTLVRELSQTGARELQCKQLQSNMPTCVQNSLNTNCPSSAAANQAVTLTRMTNECVVQLDRLLAGQFSSAQLICCVQAFIISWTTTESPLLQQTASVMQRLEVKGEYYQNCSVLCCVWQLCTSVCAKMWAVIKFMFVRVRLVFSCLQNCSLYFLCVSVLAQVLCCYLVLLGVFSTEPKDWLGRPSPKWPILCQVGR